MDIYTVVHDVFKLYTIWYKWYWLFYNYSFIECVLNISLWKICVNINPKPSIDFHILSWQFKGYVIFLIWYLDLVFHMVTLFCYYIIERSYYHSLMMSSQHCTVITYLISSFYNSGSSHWVGDCNLCLWQINFINDINNHMVEMKQQRWKIGFVLWCLLRLPRKKRCSVRFHFIYLEVVGI